MLARSLLQRRILTQAIPLHVLTSRRNLALASALQHACSQPPSTPSSLICRHLSISTARRNAAVEATTTTPSTSTFSTPSSASTTSKGPDADDVYSKVYLGPLDSTFRRLKIFSLASLTLSTTLAPFMFVIESNLPMSARLALASIAITTSGVSTGLVSWCGRPYVTELRYIRPEENGGAEGMEMTTVSLTLKPRITKVYDPSFLVDTRRPFAKWELAETAILPESQEGTKQTTPGQEETVAETTDKDGNPLGRWVVTWGENGQGTCRELGNVVRYFNVHEELLP